jgi:hypothetical protein
VEGKGVRRNLCTFCSDFCELESALSKPQEVQTHLGSSPVSKRLGEKNVPALGCHLSRTEHVDVGFPILSLGTAYNYNEIPEKEKGAEHGGTLMQS